MPKAGISRRPKTMKDSRFGEKQVTRVLRILGRAQVIGRSVPGLAAKQAGNYFRCVSEFPIIGGAAAKVFILRAAYERVEPADLEKDARPDQGCLYGRPGASNDLGKAIAVQA